MVRQALNPDSVPFGTPIHYRIAGQGRWLGGETVELLHAELMFLCDTPLELHADVELLLPTKVEVMGRESPLDLLCSGTVVRRFLANWPELRTALVVDIANCRIAPDNGLAKPTGTEANRG